MVKKSDTVSIENQSTLNRCFKNQEKSNEKLRKSAQGNPLGHGRAHPLFDAAGRRHDGDAVVARKIAVLLLAQMGRHQRVCFGLATFDMAGIPSSARVSRAHVFDDTTHGNPCAYCTLCVDGCDTRQWLAIELSERCANRLVWCAAFARFVRERQRARTLAA
jgi:hypothetical protein